MKYLPIIIIFFAACTPQQRLNRLYKKHPHLFPKDTMVILDTAFVEIPVIDTAAIDSAMASVKIEKEFDTIYIHGNLSDSQKAMVKNIERNLRKKYDAMVKDAMAKFKDKPCINHGDTLSYLAEGIVFKVWQEGNKLGFAHQKTIITEKANITVTEPKKGLQWYWIILIGFLLGIIGTLFLRR